MILADLAMKPIIWGVGLGVRAVTGAGKAVINYGIKRGGANKAGRFFSSIGSGMASSAASYFGGPTKTLSSLVIKKDPTSIIGYSSRKYLDDIVLLGLAGVGVAAGISRGAKIGPAVPGEHQSLVGAPMTPQRLRKNSKVNPIDNLGADGSLALSLHHLR